MIWKDVKGYEGIYKISEYGNIENVLRKKEIKSFLNRKKYKMVFLYGQEKRLSTTLHKVVAYNFIGEKPFEKAQVNHIDADKNNNHYSNLEYVSCQENIQHIYRIGKKSNAAEKHPCSIFTNKNVIDIRMQYDSGVSTKDIAKQYNAKYCTMWKIVKRKNYSSI